MPKVLDSTVLPARRSRRVSPTTINASMYKQEMNHPAQLLIVAVGMCIGAIFAISIAYNLHIQPTLWHIALLTLIPLSIALLLRQVYIYTLIHMEQD